MGRGNPAGTPFDGQDGVLLHWDCPERASAPIVTLVPRDLLGSSFELPRGFALRAFTPPEVYLETPYAARRAAPYKTKRGASVLFPLQDAHDAFFSFSNMRAQWNAAAAFAGPMEDAAPSCALFSLPRKTDRIESFAFLNPAALF